MSLRPAGAEGRDRVYQLSTIRGADKIIALEEGRIREVGDHHELLTRGGLYSQLYQRQLELAVSRTEEG